MKYSKFFVLIIPALLLINTSCIEKKRAVINGGSCSYVKFEGHAVIKSITPAPASDYNCPEEPQKIIFEFIPSNVSDRQKYKFTNFSDSAVSMKINDGANPSMTWVKNNKIEKGKKFRCFRTELVKGTCTPVIFTFTDLDLFPVDGCS